MRGNALERHTTHSDALTHLASLLHRTTHTRKEAHVKNTSNAGWSSHTATVHPAGLLVHGAASVSRDRAGWASRFQWPNCHGAVYLT